MHWESVSWLQKTFMQWFNKERSKQLLTFPVESLSLLNKNGCAADKEWADFAAEMYSKGHSFFIYTSDSVDSLASCCRLRNAIQENTLAIRQAKWDEWARQIKALNDTISDNDFITTLLSYTDKLISKEGQLTGNGWATQASHLTNMETHRFEADRLYSEIQQISDADDKAAEHKRELVEQYQAEILAIYKERDAIKDLMEQAYKAQLDWLKKIIKAYEDMLNAQKDYKRRLQYSSF